MGYFSDKSKREEEVLVCLQELKNEMRGLKDDVKTLAESQKTLEHQMSELKDAQNTKLDMMQKEIGNKLADARERLVHIENRANEILNQETGDIYLTIEKEE